MAASVTTGRALRYAGGSARGLLHHFSGHYLCPDFPCLSQAVLKRENRATSLLKPADRAKKPRSAVTPGQVLHSNVLDETLTA